VNVFNIDDINFSKSFEEILKRGKMDIDEVSSTVKTILDEIKRDGNGAIGAHIERFDSWKVQSDKDLEISKESMRRAYETLDSEVNQMLSI